MWHQLRPVTRLHQVKVLFLLNHRRLVSIEMFWRKVNLLQNITYLCRSFLKPMEAKHTDIFYEPQSVHWSRTTSFPQSTVLFACENVKHCERLLNTGDWNRVPTWWRHKHLICEITNLVVIFRKNKMIIPPYRNLAFCHPSVMIYCHGFALITSYQSFLNWLDS